MKWKVEQYGGGWKVIEVEPGATKGATVGKNLYWGDGTLVTEAELRAGSTTPVTPGTTITSWSLILNIPPNVTALGNTVGTGIYVITGAGTSATRQITSADGSVTITNPNGVAGDIDLAASGLPYPYLTDQLGNRLTDQSGNYIKGNTPAIPWAWISDGPVLSAYTLATLPSVVPAWRMIAVTDLTGGAEPCYSDGTNWRRCSDRSIAS